VIFDMDGVLIDAKEWHYEALNKALGLFGMEISRHDHLVTYDGLPTRMKLQMLSMERGLPVGLHDFISIMKQQYTMELVYSHCKPKFHHQYALSRLRSMGYKLAVCSNYIHKTVETMLDRSALLPLFEFVLSNEDVVDPKPAPEMYTKCIELLGMSPDQCLILEDNEKGIKAALASGAHLLRIYSVDDVDLSVILKGIATIEGDSK